MNRVERKLFKLNERLEELREEERLLAGELDMHRHLDDDARRDAAVYGTPIERLNAGDTSGDVERFERVLTRVRTEIGAIEERRLSLLTRLGHL